jgi:hypothetical protein
VPHVTAASPGLYEQVLVARGARDGGALIEGILPDQEKTVSDLLSTAHARLAVQALEPDPARLAHTHSCRPSCWGRTWPRPSAPASATASRWSARRAR